MPQLSIQLISLGDKRRTLLLQFLYSFERFLRVSLQVIQQLLRNSAPQTSRRLNYRNKVFLNIIKYNYI